MVMRHHSATHHDTHHTWSQTTTPNPTRHYNTGTHIQIPSNPAELVRPRQDSRHVERPMPSHPYHKPAYSANTNGTTSLRHRSIQTTPKRKPYIYACSTTKYHPHTHPSASPCSSYTYPTQTLPNTFHTDQHQKLAETTTYRKQQALSTYPIRTASNRITPERDPNGAAH